MTVIRGSVTRIVKKQGFGFILGEDGCEVYFDRSGLEGVEVGKLSVGQWVEYEIQFGPERLRATNIRPLFGDRESPQGAVA